MWINLILLTIYAFNGRAKIKATKIYTYLTWAIHTTKKLIFKGLQYFFINKEA